MLEIRSLSKDPATRLPFWISLDARPAARNPVERQRTAVISIQLPGLLRMLLDDEPKVSQARMPPSTVVGKLR